MDGQEEVRLAGDPAPAVEGDAAAGNETVDVRVMDQRMPPRVQHRDQADCGAEPFGGESHERLGGGAHEQAVDGPLVLECDLGGRRRQSEDDVEVGNRQQFGLTSGEPLGSRRSLTLAAMTVAARNGRRPLRALD